jgi:hypothetical protein
MQALLLLAAVEQSEDAYRFRVAGATITASASD